MGPDRNGRRGISITRRGVILVGAPLLSLFVILFLDLDPGRPEVTRMAAVALLMAIWWMSEALPLGVTALLPVVLFPLLRIMGGKSVAPLYFNHIIFLFIGGFIVALAMKKWNLHKRIALRIMLTIGSAPRRILLGFMAGTWFLSMWISNTASTMMMVPIALAVIFKLEETFGRDRVKRLSLGILLGTAYGASIGGIATLIGTPPNLSFTRILTILFPRAPEISFATWSMFAFPLSLVFLLIVWVLLSFWFCPGRGEIESDVSVFREEYRRLGPLRFEEGAVLTVFCALALLWITRADITVGSLTLRGWASRLGLSAFVNDGTVAVFMALLLFLIPSRTKGERSLMDWRSARELPWGIVLLFGGGFALASGFKESGLSAWIGGSLSGIGSLHPIVLVALICLMVTFLTELTSNTATTEMFLPILAAGATAASINPLLLMIPATLSASCAFMLPVATPPNAIIFGTNRVKISQMARVGLVINLIGVVLISLAIHLLGRFILGIEATRVPPWAGP
jgi:sodium-dependent dicarboxylate transporter 2/3/5